jgi:hypothetical protein
MNAMESLMLWIGTHFTADAYITSTKIQGLTWSLADIVLVFVLLKIAGMIRAKSGKKKILFRYLFLYLSALLTPLLLLTTTPRQFLWLESLICGIQFLILAYTVILEGKDVLRFVTATIDKASTISSSHAPAPNRLTL